MFADVRRDLAAEHADLDAIVGGMDEDAWGLPTPAPGWSVADQIGHLAVSDVSATVALSDPEAFEAEVAALRVGRGLEDWLESHLDEPRRFGPSDLLAWWRSSRASLLAALETADPAARVPWYGPPMSAVSFASARLMETWAHGQDVADALGVTRLPTARLRHVAHIGVRAMPWSFRVHGLGIPESGVRVELRSPDRDLWVWGDDDDDDVVRGSALDFCLVVTQRRHPDDARLEVRGRVAEQWIGVAQAFAGPPGTGRRPGEFRDG